MGTWNFAPWDNDEAADWYGSFMDRTKLRDAWLDGIGKDPAESPAVVRAAGALFVMLGRVYIWPIETFDEDLEKAIAGLVSVTENDEYLEEPEFIVQINQEIDELKSRRPPSNLTTSISKKRRAQI